MSKGVTGSKRKLTCNPVECGWLCKLCKKTDDDPGKILDEGCSKNSAGHVLVESPFVCTECFSLGANFASFNVTDPCPKKKLDFSDASGTPTEEPPEVRDKKVSLGAVDLNHTRKIRQEMEAAQKEIDNLRLLKRIRDERQQLADLLAKKRKSESFLASKDIMIYDIHHASISCINTTHMPQSSSILH